MKYEWKKHEKSLYAPKEIPQLLTAYKKKPNALFKEAFFEEMTDGLSVQILHIGSYDNEPRSFEIMKTFMKANNLERTSPAHREIYLSDAGKTEKEKLKTILRYAVKNIQ